MDLKPFIQNYPNFPKPGIVFRDINPLLRSADAMQAVCEQFSGVFKWDEIDLIAGIEARGLMFSGLLSAHFNKGMLMVRKAGKLPGELLKMEYELEYGLDALEIQKDALQPGQRVLLIDDLLATGGTAMASTKLIEQAGGVIAGVGFVVELLDLKGRDKLRDYNVQALIKY